MNSNILKKSKCLGAIAFMVAILSIAGVGCSSSSVDEAENPEGSEVAVQADTADAEIPQEMVEPLPEPTAQQDAALDPELSAPGDDQAKTDEEPSASADVPAPSAPAAFDTSTSELASYTVQRGDTLMRIAFQIYGDIMQWKTLYEANKDRLQNSSRLAVGTEIKYPRPASEPVIERNGDQYLIKSGDTLAGIATEIYAKPSKWRKIWQNNKALIRDPNKIYAGFYLYYQITEEEKQEAERIRGHQQQQNLGAAPAESNPSAAGSDQTTSNNNPNVNNAEDSGLQGLIQKPNNNRVPASATK